MTQFDVAILGAGPSGLTAAYCLGKAGARVAVLERAPHCGGLMRGIRRGDVTLDLGRKELYARFPEVHTLWSDLLGDDYREYPHRVGSLFGGRILETDAAHKGPLRGMSLPQTARLAASYAASQLKPGPRTARSVEDFYLLRYGRSFYNTFVHGFHLKFEGRSPAHTPHLEGEQEIPRFGFLQRRVKPAEPSTADPLFSGQPTWRHPAKGTQQIVDRLEAEARSTGVHFLLDTEVQAIQLGADSHRLCLKQNGVPEQISARYVISSAPLPLLTRLLEPALPDHLRTPPAEEALFKKSTALVYLLADGDPAFPHNWLEVNDLTLKMGRVVNYATWNGTMIPPGKTALCIEFFALEGDPVMDLDNDGLRQLAIHEASQNGLIDPSRITDHLVLKLPKVNAGTVIHDRKQAWLRDVAAHLETLPRFFETSRPGIDRATLAGIDAARACLSGAPMHRRSLAASAAEL